LHPAHEAKIFRQHAGGLRMSEALRLGINRRTLYAMRDAGVLDVVTRGRYRLASLEPLANPDLVAVATRVPQGVLCLISALSFHELTTQVPHTIDVALERGTRKPRLDYPPTRFFWFSGPAFHEGIETHTLDGVPVRSSDPEKTLADCFRYRNQLGMDVVLEALRLWRERRRKKLDVLLTCARNSLENLDAQPVVGAGVLRPPTAALRACAGCLRRARRKRRSEGARGCRAVPAVAARARCWDARWRCARPRMFAKGHSGHPFLLTRPS
jgi:hypothetical protein